MNRQRKLLALAVMLTSSALLASCAGNADGGSPGPGEGGGSAPLPEVATEILPMPTHDDSDGLVLAGESIADAELLAAAREETLVWYTGSGQESAELTAARFEAETGVKIEMTRLPSSKLSERVLSEAGAGRLGAGVVTVTDPVIAENFAADGILVAYETPGFDSLTGEGQVVWNDGEYYTAYYSAYAFAYNNQIIDAADAPTKWMDLVEPRWENQFGLVNAGAGGTVQGLAFFQEQQFGEEYWHALAALNPRIFDTTSPQLEALARGEISVATAGFNSTYGAIIAGAPITLVVPEDGISGTFNMQGLTTTGEDSAAAKLFMNWTMGKSGQEFAAAQGFVGVRTDIEQVPTGPYQLPRADDPSFFLYTPEDAEQYGQGVVARWNAAFGYTG